MERQKQNQPKISLFRPTSQPVPHTNQPTAALFRPSSQPQPARPIQPASSVQPHPALVASTSRTPQAASSSRRRGHLPSSSEASSSEDELRTPSPTIRSKRGMEILYDEEEYEYYFYRHNATTDRDDYRCSTKYCTGKAEEIGGRLVEYSEHSHLPPERKKAARMSMKVAKAARRVGSTVERILYTLKRKRNPSLPDVTAQRRQLERAVEVRGRSEWPCPIDEELFDRRFVRFNNCANFTGPNPGAMVMMVTDAGLDRLRQEPHHACDGTFHAAPKHFLQVLTYGVQSGHLFVPSAYAFLCDKSAASYHHFYDQLRQLGVQPRSLNCDFEQGIATAARRVFGNLEITRCAFHLSQAVYRKAREFHHTALWRSDRNGWAIKGLMALALLDPVDVKAYFRELAHAAILLDPSLEDLYSYFERTYVGTPAVEPIYPISEWSVYNRLCDRRQGSNSSQESFHATIKCIPSKSSAALVAKRLFEVDGKATRKMEEAQNDGVSIHELVKQKRSQRRFESKRRRAILRGARGRSRLEHLKGLLNYMSFQH